MAQPEATGQAPALVTFLRGLAVIVLIVGVIVGIAVQNDTGENVAIIAGLLQGLLGFAVLMGLAFMCDILDQIRENTTPRS